MERAPSPDPIGRPAAKNLERPFALSRPVENAPPRAWHGSKSAPYIVRSDVRPVLSPASATARQLRRVGDRGPRRARAGPPPPRHVYRRHRRARAPPPRRRGHRQCDGRGGRRLRHPDRGRARARQPPDRHRQRPRHPGRPAPQISRQVGARSDHDHAPLGREVRGQGIFDLGRPPRRRGQRRQRAVDRNDRRGRARQEALPPDLLARPRDLEAARRSAPPPTAAAPPSPSRPIPRSSAPKPPSVPSASTSSPAPRPISSPASRSAGAATPRSPPPTSPRQAVFQFPGGLADHLAEQLGDRPAVTNQPFTGRQDFPNEPGQRRMGGRLAALFATAAKAIIATPSRRPTAAPTRRACAPR